MHDIHSTCPIEQITPTRRHRDLPWLYIILLALVAAMLLTASPVWAAVYQVSDLGDTGAAGQLRWAIAQANANPGGDRIEFAVAGTIAIALGSLPALTDDCTWIDGSTAPDDLAGPDIVIDGGGVGGLRGLTLQADSCVVTGLTVRDCDIGIELSMPADSASTRFNHVGRAGGRDFVVSRENATYGIFVTGPRTTHNHITHCFVGTDYTGTVAAPNGSDGIVINGQAAFNQVGSFTDPAPTCVVSANGGDGIFLANCDANVIVAGYVGTDISGTAAMGNGASGIDLQGAVRGNRILGCVVSGNGGDGIHLGQGARRNVVEGCRIGTDLTGSSPLANGESGVHLTYAQINRLGPGNLISGNALEGIVFEGVGCDSNRVVQSQIGTDRAGAAAIANGMVGILMTDGPTYNLVTGCLVSGNARSGVVIRGSGTDYNEVLRSQVGSDRSGYAALPNGGHGIVLADEACYNWIGRAAGLGNLIAGHDAAGLCGVLITDPETSFNHVAGSIIGLDAAADGELPNYHGVRTRDNAVHNFIGPENIISGNDDTGLQVDAGTQEIFRNTIGLAGSGVDARPNRIGIWITAGTNLVSNNYVSANEKTGILVGTGCNPGYNEFAGNQIGLDQAGNPAGNGADGMWFLDDAPYNLVGLSASTGNAIWHNAEHGIRVGDAAGAIYGPFENLLQYNSIGQNGLMGIENEDGGNQETTPPVITAVSATQIDYTVALAGTVQFFYGTDDEGQVFLGEDTPGAAGAHSFAASVPSGVYVTATVTPAATNDTSEFSGAVWHESAALEAGAGGHGEDAQDDAQTEAHAGAHAGAQGESQGESQGEAHDGDQDQAHAGAPVAEGGTWVGPVGPNPVRLSGSGAAAAGLQLHLAAPARVRLALHDAAGRLVPGASGGATVLDLPAGTHHLSWDGADGASTRLATGCYYLTVAVEHERHVRKFVTVR